jgi:hypothetical protein
MKISSSPKASIEPPKAASNRRQGWLFNGATRKKNVLNADSVDPNRSHVVTIAVTLGAAIDRSGGEP